MNCDHCEFNPGCSIRKGLEDGTAVVQCDVDLWLQERMRAKERELKRKFHGAKSQLSVEKMNKCNSCAYNTVCSGEHEGCRYLPATVIVCQMCGEEIKEDEEVFTVEVDGTEMEVCAECATEIELR